MSPDSVMEYRISALEGSVNEIKSAVKSIDSSLQVLSRLEQRHAETRDGLGRAFSEMEDHEKRLRVMEVEMPTTKLIRGWIITAVVGTLGIVGVTALKLVMS